MTSIVLVISSFCMGLPVLKNIIYQENKVLFSLDCFLLFTFFISMLFWARAVKNSFIHKLDSIFSKIAVAICSFFFMLYIENDYCDKLIYLFCFFLMGTFFSLGTSLSRRNWCSANHIIVHAIFHIIATISLFHYMSEL